VTTQLGYVEVVRRISVGRPAAVMVILALRFLTGLPWTEAALWGLLVAVFLDFRVSFRWRWW
jgi:hypothetical protein